MAVEDNYLTAKFNNSFLKKDITYKLFNDAMEACKNTKLGCESVIKKYWSEHQANFKALESKCGNGGLTCPTWEEILGASLNTAKKLEDPDARKIAVLMLTQDLLMLENGIDVRDRTFSMLADPLALATLIGTKKPSGAALSLARTKAILKDAGITSIAGMSIDAGLQQLVKGEINYRDVIATGLSSAALGGIGSNARPKVNTNIPQEKFIFTTTGVPTSDHFKRTTNVNGNSVTINSGHGYNRAHSTGDVRDSGLSMDQVDSAILNDIKNNVNISSIPTIPARKMPKNININGYSLTYDIIKLPNGRISVSTYYPGR